MADQTMLMGAAPIGVLAAVMNRDTVLADFARKGELVGLKDSEYYPLSLYLELCSYLEDRLGHYAFLKVGRRMGSAVMARAFPPGLKTVEEAMAQIDAAHKIFCKPLIGAFETSSPGPGRVSVLCTAPYNCMLQEGLFYEVAMRYGAPDATVTHDECRRKGAPACRFEIRY